MHKGNKTLVFKKKTDVAVNEEENKQHTTEVNTAETEEYKGGRKQYVPKGKQIWKPKNATVKPEEHIQSEEVHKVEEANKQPDQH